MPGKGQSSACAGKCGGASAVPGGLTTAPVTRDQSPSASLGRPLLAPRTTRSHTGCLGLTPASEQVLVPPLEISYSSPKAQPECSVLRAVLLARLGASSSRTRLMSCPVHSTDDTSGKYLLSVPRARHCPSAGSVFRDARGSPVRDALRLP